MVYLESDLMPITNAPTEDERNRVLALHSMGLYEEAYDFWCGLHIRCIDRHAVDGSYAELMDVALDISRLYDELMTENGLQPLHKTTYFDNRHLYRFDANH